MTRWTLPSRKLAAFACAAALGGTACGGLGAVSPDANGEVLVRLDDYGFTPSTIRVKAGQPVTFVLTNIGQHQHEFMIGHDPVVYDDYLNNPFVDPFAVDFFEGLDITFEGQGMAMNFAGMAPMDMDAMGAMGGMSMGSETPSEGGAMGGMSMGSETPSEGGAMGGMSMGSETPSEGGAMGGMSMGSETPSEGGAMGGMSSEDGGSVVLEPDAGHAEGEEAEHGEGEAEHGGMVMLDTDQSGRLTMTIPADRVGTWTIGCFEEEGAHFADGMRATLIVEAA